MTLEERINSPGPKKILTLDGGGIRGIITLEILMKLEKTLRERFSSNKNFVLAEYFDFISGTSTGAIIAAGLSRGWTVEKIRNFYLESGKNMFHKAFILRRMRYKYKYDKLKKKLKEVFGSDTMLGSEEIKTILMIVMRNATTDSPWPVSNNPYAKYNDKSRPDCNLNLPLWQLVRASTAAPVYFPPETVQIGEKKFVFVDGGVTTYNNPSFQSFLMATIEPYKLNWQIGENKILIVSVGTGTNPKANTDLKPKEMNLIYNATSIPSALMFAALNEQDTLCRVFGKCLVGDQLDREIEDLIDSKGPVEPKLFTYIRYNVELSRESLDNLGLYDIKPKNVQKMDTIDHINDLQRVGQAVTEKKVKIQDFTAFL